MMINPEPVVTTWAGYVNKRNYTAACKLLQAPPKNCPAWLAAQEKSDPIGKLKMLGHTGNIVSFKLRGNKYIALVKNGKIVGFAPNYNRG